MNLSSQVESEPNVRQRNDYVSIQSRNEHSIEKYCESAYSVLTDSSTVCPDCQTILISKREQKQQPCCLKGKYVLPTIQNMPLDTQYQNLLQNPVVQGYAHILNRSLSPAIIVTEPTVREGGSLKKPFANLCFYVLHGRTYAYASTQSEKCTLNIVKQNMYWNEERSKPDAKLENELKILYSKLFTYLQERNQILTVLSTAQNTQNVKSTKVFLRLQRNTNFESETEIALLLSPNSQINVSNIICYTYNPDQVFDREKFHLYCLFFWPDESLLSLLCPYLTYFSHFYLWTFPC